jgi:cytochrome P450
VSRLIVTAVSSREAEDVVVELFTTPDGRRDPYPRYHRLRELAPVHRSETLNAWLLTCYDDCASALRDPRLGKDYARTNDLRRPGWRNRPALARAERSMLNTDGPYHTRLRKLVSRDFTPRNVESLRPRIEAMVEDHLDPMAEAGHGDLMARFAFPLPVRVIGELLGVPEDDRPQFRDLVRDLTATLELGATAEELDRADAAWVTIDGYFRKLIEMKRAEPDDSLLGMLVSREDVDDALTTDELISLASLVFAAGFETTTNLIGNGVIGLLRQPDQLQLLRDRPELITELPDELLRYDGTVQMTTRFAKEEIAFGDVTIPAGETIFMVVGAGNHDPDRYADPDRIDVTRTQVKPLTFGGGVHFCIGAALARLEIEIFFRRLLTRFETIELEREPEFRDRLTLRGVPELHLILREGAGAPPTATAPSPSIGSTERATVPARAADGDIEIDAILPPRPGGDADRAWRAAFRQQVEARGGDGGDLAPTIALLKRVPLFRGCTSDDLAALAAGAFPIGFDRGERLCVEGADAPECYVIAEGEAECTVGGLPVATVGMDDVVGELGPLSGRPRAATVTATTHMVAYAISRDELARLIESNPRAAAAIRAHLDAKYREHP